VWALTKHATEVRFEHEYLYWDRTGAVARTLVRTHPGAEVSRADTDVSNLRWSQLGLIVSYSHRSAGLVHDLEDSSDVRKVQDIACTLFEEVFRQLEVRTLTRIGNRITFEKRFSDAAQSIAYVDQAAKLFGLSTTLFEKSGDPRFLNQKLTNFVVRLEGTDTGMRIEATSGQTQYKAPKWVKEKMRDGFVSYTDHFAKCDVDVYTRTPLTPDQFLPAESMNSAVKLVETRILPLFG